MWQGLLISAISSEMARAQEKGDIEEVKRIYDKAVAQYGDAIVPALNKELKNYEVGPSAFDAVQEDKDLLDAQRRVLSEWEGIRAAKGDDAQFRHAMNEASRNTQSRLAANNAAIMQRLGASGSPNNALAMALMSDAGAAAGDIQGRADEAAAAEAAQRYLRALEQSGALSGDIRTQDYRLKADRARANDAINQFNAGMRVDAQKYANEMAQRDFANRMSLADSRAAAQMGQAKGYGSYAGADAAHTRQMGAGAAYAANEWARQNAAPAQKTGTATAATPDATAGQRDTRLADMEMAASGDSNREAYETTEDRIARKYGMRRGRYS